MNKNSCIESAIHKDIVTKVIENMPNEENLYNLADFFKVFGDGTRIKIICALFQSEMCVYDIANILDISQSAVSHQLRMLKQNSVVKYRKEGKMVFYSLDDQHIKDIVYTGLSHINHK
ncbi:ArsR/SmtB family transcription factor [Clostridiisalibacter paucivorans]|uniref:ArsR/SmtB family transcription factor n=1 Tax=Clostridiisalibacter paucivorans TaxID=408753 RepID=UPI00047EE82E|nr:metalloregulator ArsR/SmtB family transcription factor [Clostridiisalibacter paucivorans]